MSGTAALHILCHQASTFFFKKKNVHEPRGGKILKSQKISVLYCSLVGQVQAMGLVSVDQNVLRHLFFAFFIF